MVAGALVMLGLVVAMAGTEAAPQDKPVWGGGGGGIEVRTLGDEEEEVGVRRGLVKPDNPLGQPASERDPRCSDFSQYGFDCVPSDQCRAAANSTINTSGAGLFSERSGAEEQALPDQALLKFFRHGRLDRGAVLGLPCGNTVDVCCQDPDAFLEQAESSGHVKGANLGDLAGCGKRNRGSVGGDTRLTAAAGEAEFGEWPHVCALLRLESVDGSADSEPVKIYECGASLLDDGVILTAAHCLRGLEAAELLVRCGEWNTRDEQEPLPHQERRVQEVLRHPEFRDSEHHYNFALLFMARDFTRARHVQPTCLPSPCLTLPNSDGPELCVAGGYGKDSFGLDGTYAPVQKEIVVPVVEHGECQRLLRGTRLGQFFRLHSSFLCAGGEPGVDTCVGDGGSPLTCLQPGGGSWFQAGIVSWGIGCGSSSPAVYASLASAACWVDIQVAQRYGESGSHFGLEGECREGQATC